MDANAKVGNENIQNDPHTITNNGKLLVDLLLRQNLTMLNATDLCTGTITRERKAGNKTEKSVIDYIVVCQEMLEYVQEMTIDEERDDVLTNYQIKKKTKKLIPSDHNILYGKFSISFKRIPRTIRKEFYQFKNPEDKKNFREETSSSCELSSCFNNGEDFKFCANLFFQTLKKKIHKCFKKVRIKSGNIRQLGDQAIQEKLKMRSELKFLLRNSECKLGKHIAGNKLEDLEDEIVEASAAKNAEVVKEHIGSIESLDGQFSQLGWWKLKQKITPSGTDPPMAKRDIQGNIITAPEALKTLYLDTYKKRLRQREMAPEYLDIYFLKSELWASRLKNLAANISPGWDMDNLDAVLKSMKNNKTADPNGMVNELFKAGCIGDDLKEALQSLFNGAKANQTIPMFITLANITTIFKNKGSRLDMKNDRGIFILTVLKKMLDKLIYFDNYEQIDEHMSDSNIGARRNRNIKDHLLVLHGVINSVVHGNEECIDLQIYDLEQAFDSLWLEDCLNDIFDTLPEENRNNKIALLYETNQVNLIAVKTAAGLTERVNIPNIVQQGGTWGSLLCSNTIDTLGKKCRNRGEYYYLYKNTSRIFPLAFVDDLNGISKCGTDSIALNTFITTQIEMKRLRFHTPDERGKSKCHKMHIGKSSSTCPELQVHGTVMQNSTEEAYLGDIISSDGKNTKNIKDRISKGVGITTKILNLLEMVCFGPYLFEIAILLRESMLVNGTITNAEVWYNLTTNEIKEFEDMDKLFFMKVLGVPGTTPTEAIYLELGVLPIGVIIKARRLNYLYTILTSDESGMLFTFFLTQWYNPTRGDWTEQVKEDLEDFKIPCDFKFIKSKSKESFKRLVKTKAKEYALSKLQRKQASHSKMDNVSYSELKLQKYFQNENLKAKEMRTIFRYRTRMEVYGENFRAGKAFTICPLCKLHIDSQELCFQCPVIKKELQLVGDISHIYKENIDPNLARDITRISDYRRETSE